MGHQRAASGVLTRLFTPQSAMQSALGRMVLQWYSRFDVFIGIMGSFEITVPREWFTAPVAFYQARMAADPSNMSWKIVDAVGRLRLISVDMSFLLARASRGELGPDEFSVEHGRIAKALDGWKTSMDSALADAAFLLHDVPTRRRHEPDNIVDSRAPGILYGPPVFAATILTCEWHSITLMHACQRVEGIMEQPPAHLVAHALAICQIIELVELWSGSPEGSLIILHPCLEIAALFVPRDSKHHMWIRRKLAALEALG